MSSFRKIQLSYFLLTLFSGNAWTKAKVNDVAFEAKKKFVIYYGGTLKSQPEVEIKDRVIQVVMKDTTIWPKIDKNIDLGNGNKGTLSAYQFDNETVRVRMTYNASAKINAGDTNTVMEDGKITVEVPVTYEKIDVKNNASDSFLTKINDVVSEQRSLTPVKESEVESFLLKNEKKITPDSKVTQVKNSKQGFNFTPYVLKFLAFIGILLSLLYFFMSIFKKGFGQKNKLGILASADSLVVLKTTYIAPKKSLLMVRAHNQVFLISSSEAGIQFLAEIKDTTGVIKDGEKELSGTNFDSGLIDAEVEEKTFKVKKDITQSSPLSQEGIMGFSESTLKSDLTAGIKNLAGQIKESVKLSDQVRSKVKNLRSLQ